MKDEMGDVAIEEFADSKPKNVLHSSKQFL